MGPRLSVRIEKNTDARALLILSREDSTTTSGSIGAADGHGPSYGLAHLVVERALGLSDAYFSLLAAGWDFTDLGGDGHPLPAEAVLANAIAEHISTEQKLQQFSSAPEFDGTIRAQLAERGADNHESPPIPEDILTGMRAELADLMRQWELLAPGDALELTFVPPRRASHARPPGTSARKAPPPGR